MQSNQSPIEQHQQRLVTVKRASQQPGYEWLTERYLRHLIFNAEDKPGSGGTIVPGNGFAAAIIRLNRRILIDLDKVDGWVDEHRTLT